MNKLKNLLVLAATVFGSQFVLAQNPVIQPAQEEEMIIEEAPVEEEVPILTIVEEPPRFPGGDWALKTFINENILYPAEETERTDDTKVIVQFVVMEDGSVDKVVVAKSGGQYFDAQAVRVVKMLPKFKPGTQRTKPVRVMYTLPILFGPSPTK